MMNEVVVGSGPSGVSLAAALIAAGKRPIVVDGGRSAGPEALALRQEVLRVGPTAAHATADAPDARHNPGQKAWFQSFESFAGSPASSLHYEPELAVRASFGVGGFSRVWGGTFAFHDGWEGWPEGTVPEDRDIALVRELVPSAVTDWQTRVRQPKAGRVAGAMSSKAAMDRFIRADRHGRWSVQPSTVAIDTRPGSENECRPCGLCLSGCPHDSIWYAGDPIQRWAQEGLVDYRPGTIVTSVLEHDDGVVVTYRSGGSTQAGELRADRVYLAAGPIATAEVLINSGLIEEAVLEDTCTAFVAALSLHQDEPPVPSHALSQWWVKSSDGQFSAQVYAPNKLHVQRLEERLPVLARAEAFTGSIAVRLHPVIAYLDPKKSDPLRVSKTTTGVRVSGATSSVTKECFAGYLKALAATMLKAGYLLPLAAAEYGQPGAGYHFGCSFPHGRATDNWGRLPSMRRVHVVDGSVLPALKVGSVTPTLMANAARIGRESAQGDFQ